MRGADGNGIIAICRLKMLQRSHLSLLAELWVPWKPKWGTPQKALTEHKAYKMHGGIGMGAAVNTPKSQ